MSSYVVTGNLDTIVAVTYTDSGLDYGKWKSQPGGTASVGTSQLFQAENRDGSTLPSEGWVSYTAADGTLFTFKWDDPVSKDNQCSSAMSNVQGNYSLPVPDYPTSGKTWTVTYKIAQGTTAFWDAPVFPDHIVEAAKCDEYDEAKVRGLIRDRRCVYLRHAFEEDMPPSAKLWCATHDVFLTPPSKALLSRDLAQFAVRGLSKADMLPSALLDAALQANYDFQNGAIGTAALSDLRRRLSERAVAARSVSDRDAELVGLVSALADRNAASGWANAVSAYLGNTKTAERDKRIDDVVKIVAARL